MSDPSIEFRTFRLAPRAPRVAIVVPGGDEWLLYARIALHRAGLFWGGQGFILVPHEGGVVADRMLHAVRRYDPDYVLGLEIGPEEASACGIASARVPTSAIAAVRDACSSYRRWDASSDAWDFEDDRFPAVPGGSVGYHEGWARPLSPIATWGKRDADVRAVAPDAPGAAGLLAAAWLGSTRAPVVPAQGPDEPIERERAYFVLSQASPEPEGLVENPGASAIASWATMRGLAGVRAGFSRDALLSVGDTATDFALALAWERTYGMGFWIPLGWSPERGQAWSELLTSAIAVRYMHGLRARGRVVVTSESVDADGLGRVRSALGEDWAAPLYGGRKVEVELADGHVWPEGLLHFASATQFDHEFAIPVAIDPGGGAVMRATPPAPVLTAPAMEEHPPERWEVDLQFADDRMPSGRGLDGAVLAAGGVDDFTTWVRTGRSGLSFNAQRFDFVSYGSTLEKQLARPKLRELGLFEWSNALLAPQGHVARHSDAGLRMEVLASLAGGRQRAIELLAGDLLEVFRDLSTTAKSSRAAFPAQDGCVIPGEGGHLSFEGIASRARSSDRASVRRLVDDALRSRLLRRGLILDCATCTRPSFIPVDSLGQSVRCPRCAVLNELTAERWRSPEDEPTWFYQPHPVVGSTFQQNGDVPMLLAAHLAARHRRYTDVAELEVTTAPGGATRPIAECDLLAHADGIVIVAEAKSNASLGEGRALRSACAKRARLARLLRADQVILATSQPEWEPATIEAMRTALPTARTPDGSIPGLRLISGLGTDSLNDVVDRAASLTL